MITKGVLLAGGTGSRLAPCTRVTNKHLLPVYNKPMIFYPLETLKKAGISDVLIITGTESAGDFMKLLGSGEELGLNLTFRVQKGAGGIADALRLAENFAGQDHIAVILGDNIFADTFEDDVKNFAKGAKIFLKEVSDPERFGVAECDEKGTVIGIEEKPKTPKTNLAITGFYLFDTSVFQKIQNLQPSDRGEFEIADVNEEFVKEGNMTSRILEQEWSDAGTHESLFLASSLARKLCLHL